MTAKGHAQQSTRAKREPGEKCSTEMGRKSSIKLPLHGAPQILLCVPIGGKMEQMHFNIPECGNKKCNCENHDRAVHTKVFNQGLVPAEWAINVSNIVIPLNTTVGYLFEKGRLSAEARNRMTERALELGAKYIFYWDDDVVLHGHMLYAAHNILETNPDIGLVSGVYMTKEDPPEPLVYKTHGRGAWWKFDRAEDAPPQDIFSCGGGCIMARLEDLAKMKKPYWTDEQMVHEGGQVMWGHDVRFVRNFREQTGKRTVVKGHLLCGHWSTEKQKMYTMPEEKPNVTKLIKGNKSRKNNHGKAGSTDEKRDVKRKSDVKRTSKKGKRPSSSSAKNNS